MTPASIALTAAASFLLVFTRAFQQLNVTGYHYWPVLPTSLLMALGEVTIVVNIIRAPTFWAFIPIGLGAGLGCISAMYLHRRYIHGQSNR